MKNFLTILLGIFCIAVLLAGHSYWNKKIAEAASSTITQTLQPETAVAGQNDEKDVNRGTLLNYTKNWPDDAAKRFKTALDAGRPFKILFVGSPAIGSDTKGVYPLVKDKLVETFGANHIDVARISSKSTSSEFVAADKQADIAAKKPDMVIFEPFILTNNGLVLIENTLKDITTIINDLQKKDPGVSFILQPSYPLYNAAIYPTQVDALKKYAEQHQITYLNHWTAWPNSRDPKLKDYLTAKQDAPSQKGINVWSNYIVKFLLGKSESE